MRNVWIVAVVAVGGALAMFGGWKLRDLQMDEVTRIPASSESTGPAMGGTAPDRTGQVTSSQRLESRPERAARIAARREAQRTETRALVAAGQRNLESAFRTEETNPAWARGKEQELERHVVNPQMDALNAIPTDFEVECKAKTCRIEAEFATPSAADDWATLYLTNNGGLLPRASLNKVRQPDGTVRLVLLGSTI